MYGHPSRKADFWDSGFGIKYVVGGRRKTDHLFLLGGRRWERGAPHSFQGRYEVSWPPPYSWWEGLGSGRPPEARPRPRPGPHMSRHSRSRPGRPRYSRGGIGGEGRGRAARVARGAHEPIFPDRRTPAQSSLFPYAHIVYQYIDWPLPCSMSFPSPLPIL